MRRQFRGIRVRVEGERADFAIASLQQQGFLIDSFRRLGDDTGFSIRTKQGPVINMYDTGTITVNGKNRHLIVDREALRMPESVSRVLIVANADGHDLLRLTMSLKELGIHSEVAFFSSPVWMDSVALAKRRGYRILGLVSSDRADHDKSQVPDLDVIFGLGLLTARLSRDRLAVLWHKNTGIPRSCSILGTGVVLFGEDVRDSLVGLRSHWQDIDFHEAGIVELDRAS